MRRTMLLVSLGILTAFGSAQTLDDGRLARRAAAGDPQATLNRAELIHNVDQLERIIRKVNQLPSVKPRPIPATSTAASRSQLLGELNRLFEVTRPKFKFTPRAVRYGASALGLPAGHPQRANAEKLIRWGFVSRVSRLVAGDRETLTLKEFGETLAIFAARTADLTHTPDVRYSPYLMP